MTSHRALWAFVRQASAAWAFAVLASAVLLTASAGVASAQLVPRSHPVGVKFEGEVHASRVYLRFASELYEEPFVQWSRRTRDEPAAAFVALVRAVQARNVEAFRPLVDVSQMSVTSKDLLTEVHSMGAGFGQMVVVARAVVGDQVVFFWRTPRPDGPATGAFAFSPRGGRWVAQLVTGAMPAVGLMNDALDYYGRQPSVFRPLDRSGSEYSVPMTPDGTVQLEFNGRALDFAPLEASGPVDDLTAAYHYGVLALAADDWAGFAALHTPASKLKIEGWLANQGRDPRARDTLAAMLAKDTRVFFVMDLGPPGAMLLVAQGGVGDAASRPVRRVMVASTASGPRLTNYFMNYQFGVSLEVSPLWPKEAGPLQALLARSKR